MSFKLESGFGSKFLKDFLSLADKIRSSHCHSLTQEIFREVEKIQDIMWRMDISHAMVMKMEETWKLNLFLMKELWLLQLNLPHKNGPNLHPKLDQANPSVEQHFPQKRTM